MSKWFDWLRRNMEADANDDGFVEVGSPREKEPGTETAPEARENWLARLRPGRRREQQLTALREGYHEMLDLVRAIRQHLDRQEQVQEKMVDVLERLPDGLDGLKNVSRAAEHQVEVLQLLRKQLEASVDHDRQLTDSMARFNDTLKTVDETSKTSSGTIHELIEKSNRSEELVLQVLRRSEKRMNVLVGLFVVLMLAALSLVAWMVQSHAAERASADPLPLTQAMSGAPEEDVDDVQAAQTDAAAAATAAGEPVAQPEPQPQEDEPAVPESTDAGREEQPPPEVITTVPAPIRLLAPADVRAMQQREASTEATDVE